ncbi:MAG TPA: MG2 domain-containing protein [Pyrinomonadaceae bacterium]|nr:MG2 domain-containing protein [Pyrinomonadaceae bacterium]
MSRRWLLSLLCLSLFVLCLVPLTRAGGDVRVNEADTRILLDQDPAQVLLAVENSTGVTVNVRVEVELLDPQNKSKAKATQIATIAKGTQKLSLSLPFSVSQLPATERPNILWQRLRYRLTEESSTRVVAEGLISLSEIAPDLFDVRVAAAEMIREGNRYQARAQATHPLTRKPIANVRIDGELKVEDDNDKSVKVRASKTTDSKGYALLDFPLPPRFPQFPHTLQPAGGELRVVGRKGALVSETEGQVLVDQFARILITTDKPLYQPGQQIHVRALLFSPSRRALANHDAHIRICDPENLTLFRAVVKTSRFGVANVDWTIPENTRLGNYRIWVGLDDREENDQTAYDVRISRYELPNFTVNVETDRKYYLPGQNAEIKVRADYLFGQPVTRGHVRVVREAEREWNYKEQKWDVDEGDKYEGEADATGMFVAQIDLANDHDRDYGRFNDITYAAYFTDPTTNRTEQRRFDVRVTKEDIHVYVVEDDNFHQHAALPLKFYVSTFYADGSPARCKVSVRLTEWNTDASEAEKTSKPVATFRTNRYGVVKVSGVKLPRDFEGESDVNLAISAVDPRGRKGSETEELDLVTDDTLRVETDKTLYRRGEPVTAFITSTVQDQTVVVDLARDLNVIRSERAKLHDGRASITFPYRSEFKDRLTIAAYPDFVESRDRIGLSTVLYPRDQDLKVNVQTSQASYRPGDDAQVNLSVRAPDGGSTESALGVVILDKAVEERFRTDQEFGGRRFNSNPIDSFLGVDEQFAGITLRDLRRVDTAKPISPELDLVAAVLLSQNRDYFPTFYGGDQFEKELTKLYGEPAKQPLKPVKDALANHYLQTAEYPNDDASLRRFLSEAQIDFKAVRDPWGMAYRPAFAVFRNSDDLTLTSAGPDKRFDSDDDFVVDRMGWPYFRPIGEAIDKAARGYHERTGGFIRDSATLRDELAKQSLHLNQLLDRWGKQYLFKFEIKERNYVVNVWSGGPDGEFSKEKEYSNDDFAIWMSAIDYFADPRAQIEATLDKNLKNTNTYPENDQDLRALLRGTPASLESLRDPWGRPYYATFKLQPFHGAHVYVESRSAFRQPATERMEIGPVIRMLVVITLKSPGPDGKAATNDDFSVATFTGDLAEQPRGAPPQIIESGMVLPATNGSIYGVVTDPMGASIAGVTVTATIPNTRFSYQTTTNDEGRYSFPGLPPGVYEVRFESSPFMAAVVLDVLVRAHNTTEVNVSLNPGAVTETVTVSAAPANALEQMSASMVGKTVHTARRDAKIVTKSGDSQISTPRLREYFPETLLWQPSIETDKDGRAQINFKLADNITTWKMLVIGSTEDGQIGTTEKEIKSFQPFFVEHEPPRVLTEGDEISLPVVVRNYLDRTQKVDLEIKPENWFALVGPGRKQTSVAAGDATRETFDLKAIASVKDGKQRITAAGSDESDAIEKPVTVHPDGEEQSVTGGDILDGSSSVELNIPDTAIPNSVRGEIRIYSNLMAHVVESVEAIMQRPYGCGEQTISSTYPSLLLLRHYKEQFPLRSRAERYVNEGYSRLMNYRDESGGFTYWGDGHTDLALTAYAVRFLTDAADVIAVDQQVIKDAREWLIKQQLADGGWPAKDPTARDAKQQRVVLTAYIARILAVSGGAEDSLKRAFNYLSQQGAAIDEPYLLGSYALAAIHAGDASLAKPLIEKLRTLVREDGTTSYWPLQTSTPFYGWGLAGQIETTAVVVQALAKACNPNCDADTKLINRGLLYLLKQKDRYGVWYSTQTTINVLDAMLTLFSTKTSNPSSGSTADVLVNGRIAQTIQMPVGDRLNNPIAIDISENLNAGKNSIEIKRSGSLPFASVQAVANYYVPWSASESTRKAGALRLRVKFDKTDGKINDEITCNVEAARLGGGWGMILAEIGVPPGADVDRGSLESAVKNSGWTISRYDVLPDRVVVYLWPPSGAVKFNFKFRPRFALNAKTAASTVYDYYNPEARAVIEPATFRIK